MGAVKPAPLRILFLEDSKADAELIMRALRAGGVACEHERVDTRAAWNEALGRPDAWDIALLDHALPGLDTSQLLEALRHDAPDLPAIVVSGTITEETAVSSLRAGARDFVTKQNLSRLVPAVLREVAAAAEVRERRATETALAQSEARFTRLVENAQDIVMSYRTHPLAFDYVSPSVERILGYTPQDFYADPGLGLRIIHPEDRDAADSAWAADPERSVLGRVVAADGRTLWLDRRQVAIKDALGEIVSVDAVARDVTEQVLAYEQVQNKERKFRAIFEGALDALLLADDDRVYVDANPAASDLLGIPHDAIVGRRVEDFVEPEGAPIVRAAWTAFLAEGRQEGEFTLRRPDGETRDTEFRATANVKPGVHLSILRDVTDRRLAQAAIDEVENRLTTMLADLPLVVFSTPIVEGSGTSYVSPHSEALLGLPREAFGERPDLFWDAIHPDDLAGLRDAQLLDRSVNDFRLRTPDGRELTIHGQHRYLHDAEGTPTHYQGFLVDMTELAAANEALRESADRLLQAQKMEAIGQLAGGIAHDFNNLLTVINGYSDIVLDRCHDDEKLRHSITEIRRAGDRAAELTHQLLAFSRQQVLKPKIVDVNDVVSDHANMLSRLIGEDIELRVSLNARGGFIQADPGQLAQVILNLAVNARDAMPAGGRLTISTDSLELSTGDEGDIPAGSYVALELRDTGCGIDPETQERIFEPFFTTKDVGKGTGLGLSTVFGVVEQSQGHIRVESVRNQGTAFRIYLPRIDTPVMPPSANEQPDAHGSETVLLVEDNHHVRALMGEILTGHGYRVVAADSPLAAMSLAAGAAGGSIRLLVTDVVMPEMNGRDLSKRIGLVLPEIRTLFVSGYTNDAVIARGILPDDSLFLQKPFSPTQLATKVREAIDLDHVEQSRPV